MRLATVTTADGSAAAVWQDGGWRALPAPDLSAYLREHAAADAPALAGGEVVDAVPALLLPSPGKVVCCGLNYGDHIEETGGEKPAYPTLFAKYADTLIGPAARIALPAGVGADWEAEV